MISRNSVHLDNKFYLLDRIVVVCQKSRKFRCSRQLTCGFCDITGRRLPQRRMQSKCNDKWLIECFSVLKCSLDVAKVLMLSSVVEFTLRDRVLCICMQNNCVKIAWPIAAVKRCSWVEENSKQIVQRCESFEKVMKHKAMISVRWKLLEIIFGNVVKSEWKERWKITASDWQRYKWSEAEIFWIDIAQSRQVQSYLNW